MADYMGKKVNLFLVIMIIVVLLGMGGMSIYFQRSFKDVNSGYENISAERDLYLKQLKSTESELTAARNTLNSTEGDIRKYDTLYEDKAKEVEDKKKQLADTQASLDKEKVFKAQFQKQAEDYYKQIQDLNSQITNLNVNINNLNKEIKDLKNELSCLKGYTDSSQEDSCE